MSWSWQIAKVSGIPIRVHWTFFLLLGWVAIESAGTGGGALAVASGVGFILALFFCVVLHELGHALVAQRFGVPTFDITLLPIGGVARLQRIPEQPGQELAIAVAGPAVNVVIVAILWLIGVRPGTVQVDGTDVLEVSMLTKLMLVNIMLVVFNLLPAFPMDGGRVLRALLAFKLNYVDATRIAASVGQMMAFLFGMLALASHNPMLFLVALFVWMGAQGEAGMVRQRSLMTGSRVRDAMLTRFLVLKRGSTLLDAAQQLLAGDQQDFPVVDDSNHAFVVLTRDSLIEGFSREGRDAPVERVAHGKIAQVESDAELEPAVQMMREENLACLEVVERGRRVGLLTRENIEEYLMLKLAIAAGPGKGQGIPAAAKPEAVPAGAD